MPRWLPLLLVLWPAAASALPTTRSGPYVDALVGAMGTVPLSGGLSWEAGAGWWFGPYDEDYAIGRFTSVGVGLRQDLRGGALFTALPVEVRRGLDVIVLGGHGFLAAGPTFAGDDVGALVEGGAGVKGRFRFSGPFVGYVLRARLGAEIGGGDVIGRGALTLGVEWAAPARRAPEGS